MYPPQFPDYLSAVARAFKLSPEDPGIFEFRAFAKTAILECRAGLAASSGPVASAAWKDSLDRFAEFLSATIDRRIVALQATQTETWQRIRAAAASRPPESGWRCVEDEARQQDECERRLAVLERCHRALAKLADTYDTAADVAQGLAIIEAELRTIFPAGGTTRPYTSRQVVPVYESAGAK